MKRLFILSCLIVCITAIAHAQTYTQHLQQKTAGKGSVIGQMIRNIDPRFFKVAPMDQPTEEEKRKPFLCRYFTKIPEAGKFMFLDSGWMDEVTRNRVHGEMDQ